MSKYFWFFCFFCFAHNNIKSEEQNSFSKAVKEENFRKVEHLFKREIKHLNRFYKPTNSGNTYFDYQTQIDSLTNWLKNKPCVLDANNDKCQTKVLIYPGKSAVGVKFKTKSGIVEKCFLIQNGTLGNVHLFKWQFHFFKPKDKLVYKKMYDCNGFIEREKENCNLLNRQIKEVDKPNNDFLNPNLIIGKWESVDTIKEHILFSYNTLLSEYNLIMPENNTYVFSANQNYFIYLNGTTIAWPPMGCKIFQLRMI